MRAVVQRVSEACVKVESQKTGEIKKGFAVLLGVKKGDEKQDAEYMAEKICNLRVFEDNDGKMNLSLMDVDGGLLVVSQFTLYGDCRKGRRPSFVEAALPEKAEELYSYFVDICRSKGIKVETGVFQAQMDVKLTNDGPVTILVDSQKIF